MTVTITSDIESGKKGILYARKGEKAEVISEYHLPVLILKIKDKTFPAHVSKTNYQSIKIN